MIDAGTYSFLTPSRKTLESLKKGLASLKTITSYGSRLVEPTWWFILIAKSNTEQMKTIDGELIKGTACLPAGYLEVWTTLHCEFSQQRLESVAIGQRPRNYSSCCCFPFVSFPLLKEF